MQVKANVYCITLLTGTSLFLPVLARADKAGDTLLQKCLAAETKAKTLQAEFTLTQTADGQTETLHGITRLKRPNLAHREYVSAFTKSRRIQNSDGSKLVTYDATENGFDSKPVDASGANIGGMDAKVFFNADTLNQFVSQGSGVKVGPARTIGGVSCKTLQVVGTPKAVSYKFYVGPDGLFRGMTLMDEEETSREALLTRVKANVSLAKAAFSWKLPKGAIPYEKIKAKKGPQPQNQPNGIDDLARDMLPIGSKAPDFLLPNPKGGKISLAALVKSHKAILVNFWSYF